MADNKNDERTVKAIISDAFDKYAQQQPGPVMTPQQLMEIVKKKKAEQRKRKLRIAGVAVLFLAVIGGTMIASDTFDAGADKNPKEEIVTEDGIVIEDGGWGSSVGQDDVWSTTDWSEVRVQKEMMPQLLVPEYIPKGYEFQELIIEVSETANTMCKYSFTNMHDEVISIDVFMQNEKLEIRNITNDSYQLDSEKGIIYVQDYENKIATIYIDDGISINIWCQLDDKEIIRIIEGIEY